MTDHDDTAATPAAQSPETGALLATPIAGAEPAAAELYQLTHEPAMKVREWRARAQGQLRLLK